MLGVGYWEKATMSGEAVKVVVRCRPLNEREKRLNSEVSVLRWLAS